MLFAIVDQIDFNNPVVITTIATIIFVLVCVIYILSRKKSKTQQSSSPKEIESVKSHLLEDRDVLDAPVEISDNMSLAEIKRVKSARIKSKGKAKRATAVEATEASKKRHEESSIAEFTSVASIEEPPEEEKATPSSTSTSDHASDSPLSFAVPKIQDPSLSEALKTGAGSLKRITQLQEAVKLDPSFRKEESDSSTQATDLPKKDATANQEPAQKTSHDPRTLEDGLAKTRSGFIDRLSGLFKKGKLDDDIVNEVEEILYTADIGPKAASRIMESIEQELHKDAKQNPAVVWDFVRNYVKELLSRRQTPIDTNSSKPFVILMIGVNGVGKTTTIGKLASKFRHEGKSVLMVAGDTFRAAAVEQLEVWGERTGIEVYKGATEQDPASVIYEGIEKAAKEGIDIVICDTAGRLQSNTNLLDELGKIGRVAGKVVDGAPHETLLVLDANTGQNALLQARKFNEAVNISGIVLTKLDGTAKGGIILGICDEIDVPIRYIGIGEAVEDLRPFKADEFVEALFM